MSIISIPGSRQGKQALVAAAGSVLLAVAVAAGVLVWQVTERSDAGTTAVSSSAVVAPEAAAAHASAGTAIMTVLYLVDSSEEESFIQGWTGLLVQQQLLAGVQPVKTSVLVAPTLDPAALDQLPGTPGARIVDLRAHSEASVADVRSPMPTSTLAASGEDALARQLEALTAESLGVPFAP